MKKYLFVTKNSLAEYFTYRLNFVLWRGGAGVAAFLFFFFSGRQFIRDAGKFLTTTKAK